MKYDTIVNIHIKLRHAVDQLECVLTCIDIHMYNLCIVLLFDQLRRLMAVSETQ